MQYIKSIITNLLTSQFSRLRFTNYSRFSSIIPTFVKTFDSFYFEIKVFVI